MPNLKKMKKAENLIRERIQLQSAIYEIENKLFKIENEYLELTQGSSLFKNLEFYIHTKPEKKKTIIEESDRVFAQDYPRVDN